MCVVAAMKLPRDIKTGKPLPGAKWRLAKIRDRSYDPVYRVRRYTVAEHGASQLFLIDADTDWTEGVSVTDDGKYLSVVNSALNNTLDKKEGTSKDKSPSVSETGRDIRRALKSGSVEELADAIVESRIDGCSLVTDGDRLFVIEISLPAQAKEKFLKAKLATGKRFDELVDPNDYVIVKKEIKDEYLVVRTNHGVFDDDFGYQKHDGDSYESSKRRRKYAEEALEKNAYEALDLIVTMSKLGRPEIDANPFYRPIRLKDDVLSNDQKIYTTSIVQTDPSGTMIVKPIECSFDINNLQNLVSSKYRTHMVILPHRSRMFESSDSSKLSTIGTPSVSFNEYLVLSKATT